jgi:hypothetical protein
MITIKSRVGHIFRSTNFVIRYFYPYPYLGVFVADEEPSCTFLPQSCQGAYWLMVKSLKTGAYKSIHFFAVSSTPQSFDLALDR